jgi:hypothetical protein
MLSCTRRATTRGTERLFVTVMAHRFAVVHSGVGTAKIATSLLRLYMCGATSLSVGAGLTTLRIFRQGKGPSNARAATHNSP